MNREIKKFRGFIDQHISNTLIRLRNYAFLADFKLNYSIIFEEKELKFYAVDRFASLPLYYIERSQNVVKVSDNIEELLEFLNYEVTFDSIGYTTCDLFFYGERSKRTLFNEIKRMEPGTYIEVFKGKTRFVRYWSFQSLSTKKYSHLSFDEAAEELGERIESSIKECLDYSENCAVHLSGGHDSGCVSALVSELSPKQRYAYMLKVENMDTSVDNSEYQYAQKVLGHYRSLKPVTISWQLNRMTDIKDHPQSDFWFANNGENVQSKIAEHAHSHHVKYVLTGLGGDELASYGSRFQSSSLVASNDFTAKLIREVKLSFYENARFTVSTLLKSSNELKEKFRVRNIYNNWSNIRKQNYKNWYTKNYLQATQDCSIYSSSYFLPCTASYRLNCLDREYFTVRSDIWNHVSQNHDVTFIHPLLHKDIVELCAVLPRHYFGSYPARALYKQAMKEYIPDYLLEESFRTIQFNVSESIESTREDIHNCLSQLKELQGSFASSVFNYKSVQKKLDAILFGLEPDDFSDSYNLAINNSLLYHVKDFIAKGEYLNRYFN